MRIQYCSDLHLELEQNSRFLLNNPIPVTGEILILAGDIVPLHDEQFKHVFFSFIADNYKQVFWVPGNHEYYHKDLTEFNSSFNIELKSNIRIVNNVEVIHEDVLFVFSTLWSQISPQNEKVIEEGVSDFEFITIKNKKLKAKDFNKLHNKSLNFLKEFSIKDYKKSVIVTHHLPSTLCNFPAHNKSLINEAFCVELTEFIKECNASYWLYGHSHFNQKPLFIGNTVLLTNQLGYVHINEQNSFNPGAYFAI